MDADELTQSVWNVSEDEFPDGSPLEEQAKFLLRYAILAPSSHNSQPWRFAIRDEAIEISYNETRWLEIADQDKRELFISIGCALENFCIAAEHFDIGHEITYRADEDDDLVATVTLEPDSEPSFSRPSELFDELTERYTSHQLFEDQALPRETREQFRRVIEADGVTLYLIDAPSKSVLSANSKPMRTRHRWPTRRIGKNWATGSGQARSEVRGSWPELGRQLFLISISVTGKAERTRNSSNARPSSHCWQPTQTLPRHESRPARSSNDSHFSRVLKHRRPSNESDLGTARNANKTRCWG